MCLCLYVFFGLLVCYSLMLPWSLPLFVVFLFSSCNNNNKACNNHLKAAWVIAALKKQKQKQQLQHFHSAYWRRVYRFVVLLFHFAQHHPSHHHCRIACGFSAVLCYNSQGVQQRMVRGGCTHSLLSCIAVLQLVQSYTIGHCSRVPTCGSQVIELGQTTTSRSLVSCSCIASWLNQLLKLIAPGCCFYSIFLFLCWNWMMHFKIF